MGIGLILSSPAATPMTAVGAAARGGRAWRARDRRRSRLRPAARPPSATRPETSVPAGPLPTRHIRDPRRARHRPRRRRRSSRVMRSTPQAADGAVHSGSGCRSRRPRPLGCFREPRGGRCRPSRPLTEFVLLICRRGGVWPICCGWRPLRSCPSPTVRTSCTTCSSCITSSVRSICLTLRHSRVSARDDATTPREVTS